MNLIRATCIAFVARERVSQESDNIVEATFESGETMKSVLRQPASLTATVKLTMLNVSLPSDNVRTNMQMTFGTARSPPSSFHA